NFLLCRELDRSFSVECRFVANGGLRCRHNFYYRLQRNCEHTPNKCRSEPRPFMTWRSGRSCAESRRTMRKWHSGSNSPPAAKRGSSCGGRGRNVAHHGRKGTLVRRGRPTRAILFICAAVGGANAGSKGSIARVGGARARRGSLDLS